MRKLFSIIIIAFVAVMPLIAQSSSKIKIADDIEIQKLSDNIYLQTSYYETTDFGKIGANGLILISNGKALMIDTPWDNNQTEKLYNWVQDSLDVSIDTFVGTHWHEDRIGGLGFLETKGVNSYANQMTIDIATEKGLPVPNHGFVDSLTIDFHKTPVVCYYLGGGHSTDNIVVWLPTENLLFGCCCIKDLSSTNLGNLADADLEAWPTTIDRISKKFKGAKTVIPGHGSIGDVKLIEHTSQLLQEKNSSREKDSIKNL